MKNNVNQEIIKPQNKNKVIIAITIVVCIVLIGLLSKDSDKKYILNIYQNKEGEYYCHNFSVVNEKCSELGFTIKTETENAKTLAFDKNYNYMLYKDNGLKIYDIHHKTIKKIYLEDSYDDYDLVLNSKNQFIGIIYQKRESSSIYYEGYYNITTNKKMYDNKYESISSIPENDKYLNAVENVNGNYNVYLLEIDSEKEEIVMPSKSGFMDISIEKYKGKNLYVGEDITQSGNYITIYSNKKEIIFTDLNSKFDYSIYNGTLYINSDNVIKKYDFDGNLIDSKKFENNNIEQIINNYVLYEDNNILKLYNIDTREDFKIIELNSNYITIIAKDIYKQTLPPTRYYTKEEIKYLDDITSSKITKTGIYIVIGYKKTDKDGNMGLIYYFDETNKTFKNYNIDNWKCNSIGCE